MRTGAAQAARPDTRPPRFRRCLFARDGVFDLGGATASRIATPHMLPSTLLNASAPTISWLYRGRDGHCWPPPAQIRACPIQALGSYLECMTRNRLSLTASRMRPCACDTASRLCVRPVLCWSAFLSVPPLPSTDSATVRTALFAGLLGTTSGSDCSVPCIIGYGLRPSQCGPVVGATGQ